MSWAARIPTLGASWSPLALGGDLYDMWDAEDVSKFALSGSSVDSWTSSKNGYAAAQAISASKPVYSLTSFNNRPGVTFDGSDDELTYPGTGIFPLTSAPGEIWALVDQTALVADTTQRSIVRYGSGNTVARDVVRVVDTGVNRAKGIVGTTASAITTNAPAVDFSGKHVVRLEIGAAASSASADGVTSASVAGVPGTINTRTRLGANSATTASAFFKGVISLIAITAPLSPAQATSMLAYLKARGGIP